MATTEETLQTLRGAIHKNEAAVKFALDDLLPRLDEPQVNVGPNNQELDNSPLLETVLEVGITTEDVNSKIHVLRFLEELGAKFPEKLTQIYPILVVLFDTESLDLKKRLVACSSALFPYALRYL